MTSNADPVRRTPRYRSLLSELRSGQKTVLLDGPISSELDSRGITMASKNKYSVILPTYNERQNLPVLVQMLSDVFTKE